MRAKLSAGRQQCKHRAVDTWNRIQELDCLRAQRACRGKKVIVPFEIKALPAAFKERIKTPVVVLGCCPDEALVEQPHRFVTDRLPIVPKFFQFRKAVNRDHRLVRNRRARVHQYVVRGEERRVIAELTPDPKTHATAEMHVNCACGENINADKLWREKLFEHIPFLGSGPANTPCSPSVSGESQSGGRSFQTSHARGRQRTSVAPKTRSYSIMLPSQQQGPGREFGGLCNRVGSDAILVVEGREIVE